MEEILKNRITFLLAIKVENCNPNGDPINADLPRMTYDGLGEISDVCLKRRIRDALEDAGNEIFVSSNTVDSPANNNGKTLTSLSAKAKTVITSDIKKIRLKLKKLF